MDSSTPCYRSCIMESSINSRSRLIEFCQTLKHFYFLFEGKKQTPHHTHKGVWEEIWFSTCMRSMGHFRNASRGFEKL